MRLPISLKLILTFVLFSLLIGLDDAGAHGYLVRSIPADRSVLTHAPHQVQIWFSEGLEPEFSHIEVLDQTGRQVDLGNGGVDPRNSAKLVANLPDDLPQGAYLVKLRPVFTSDGHAVSDTMVFWVGEPVGSIAGDRAADTAIPLEAVWRVVLTLALTVLSGTIWVYVFVVRPTWGNPRWGFGHLPPRVMRRLSLLIWTSLLTALMINGLALIQMAMALFGASFEAVLSDGLWEIVLQGTHFGDIWQIRTLLLIGILLVQIVAAQQVRNRPDSTHVLWLLNGILAVFALGTLSLISHAAGAPLWPTAAVLADFLHVSAVAAWVGALLVMALILRPALIPLSPEQRGLAIKAILNRFSTMALISVSLIIFTGIYATFAAVYQPQNLVDTTYGLTLIAKWILMLPLLGLGALHYILLSPERQQKAAAWLRSNHWFAKLPQSIRLEAIFALIVLAAGGILPATPPPVPPNARGEVSIETQQLDVEGYQVEMAVHPAAVGANAYDVRVLRNGESAPLQAVEIRFSYPEYGRYTDAIPMEETEAGLWSGAGGDLYRAGTWDALVDFVPAEGDAIRAAFKQEFVIEVEDESSRRASFFNYLSAFGILAVLGLWTAPLLYRYGTKLDWRPEIVAATLLAVVLTAGITIGGAYFFQQTSESVQEQREAPPDRINVVFADQSSTAQGREIYEQQCLECHSEDGNDPGIADVPLLSEALKDRDDEALYRILSRGIVGRHQYGIDLTEQERWSLINYLRMIE